MKTEQFSTVKIYGKTHVIRACDRSGSIHKSPNFNGTGRALCAVLNDNETFENWVSFKSGKFLSLK